MEFSGDKYQSDGKQSNPLFAVLRTVKSLFGRLIRIFTLSDEERLKAGIYLGGEGRE